MARSFSEVDAMYGDAGEQEGHDKRAQLARGIELRHLRYALLAADLRSLAKASSRLGIKHATLRRHIDYLERSFGTALFTRSPRGVMPTEAGHVFIESARRVLDEMEGLYAKTRSVGNGTAGSVGLGFFASITAGNLRSALFAFEDSYPHIRLQGVEEPPGALHTKLDAGVLDILIISGNSAYPGTVRLGLWSEPISYGQKTETAERAVS
jgi:DNA-binding transcriptional LysR family regulator